MNRLLVVRFLAFDLSILFLIKSFENYPSATFRYLCNFVLKFLNHKFYRLADSLGLAEANSLSTSRRRPTNDRPAAAE